jgi:hypothetical protein
MKNGAAWGPEFSGVASALPGYSGGTATRTDLSGAPSDYYITIRDFAWRLPTASTEDAYATGSGTLDSNQGAILFMLDGQDLAPYLDSDNTTLDFDAWSSAFPSNLMSSQFPFTALQSFDSVAAGAGSLRVFTYWTDGVNYYASQPSEPINYPA